MADPLKVEQILSAGLSKSKWAAPHNSSKPIIGRSANSKLSKGPTAPSLRTTANQSPSPGDFKDIKDFDQGGERHKQVTIPSPAPSRTDDFTREIARASENLRVFLQESAPPSSSALESPALAQIGTVLQAVPSSLLPSVSPKTSHRESPTSSPPAGRSDEPLDGTSAMPKSPNNIHQQSTEPSKRTSNTISTHRGVAVAATSSSRSSAAVTEPRPKADTPDESQSQTQTQDKAIKPTTSLTRVHRDPAHSPEHHLGTNLVLSEMSAALRQHSSSPNHQTPNFMQQPQSFRETTSEAIRNSSRPRSRKSSAQQTMQTSTWKGPEIGVLKTMVTGRSNGKWPTADEVRYNPANHITSSEENDSAIASDRVDLDGAVTVRKPRQKPPQELKLQDWSGGWAPPPIDWEGRHLFADRRLVQTCATFVDELDNSGHDIGLFQVPQQDLLNHDGQICPSAWVPEKIEEITPDAWHAEKMFSMEEEDKHCQGPPFWRLLLGEGDERVRRCDVPEAKVDPTDNDMSKINKETSERSVKTKMVAMQKKQAKTEKFKKERKEFLHAQKYGPVQVHERSPKVNIYLRPAELRDLPQIQEIYNHWIQNTIYCPERSPLDRELTKDRWTNVIEVELPFLVAADRSSKGNRRKNNGPIAPEHIVGFAFADDFMSFVSMYRYAVEIECFVHPDYLRRNVGRTLVDKLMCALDPDFASAGGYDFIGNELLYSNGGKRIIGTILIHMPYETHDKTKLAWCGSWVEQYGFQKAATYPEIGRKMGMKVDLAVFIKKTGSNIAANAL